jgi:hypothetical protein
MPQAPKRNFNLFGFRNKNSVLRFAHLAVAICATYPIGVGNGRNYHGIQEEYGCGEYE